MRRLTLFTTAFIALTTTIHAAPRSVQQFTDGWKFIQADAAGAEQSGFDDSAWAAVTLPHDWAINEPVNEDAPTRAAGGFFPAGIGWYRKTFDWIPTSGHKSYIVFDGVMANSDVYCNGKLMGHRPYGYVSFFYDLTPALRAGKNTIAVRVDNSQQPASRFYAGAGINRKVRLVTVSDVHIAPWGTFVTTPKVSADSTTVHVRATIANDSESPATVTMSVSISLPNGSPLLTDLPIVSKPVNIPPHTETELNAEVSVPHPDRWDIGHGALYTAHVSIQPYQKPMVDNEDVPFGIREFHFDPNQGFFLNGVHHKIYGAAIHTDAGAFGTAVPLAAYERRLTELRKLGVNAIRTAHNPPTPEFLDLADRMGFLVMDEMFDCWTVGKNTYDYHLYFKNWSLRDTADTVKRDRNHPSIILWSAGNEIHDTPKPEIAIPILKSLVDTFHQNDSTRPVTQALFRPNVSHDYDNGLADLLDVVGQNYREQEILKAHADKPTRAIIGTENTHDRNQWVALRDHPEYSGQFLWSGVDYLGEAGAWPNIGSGSGLLLTTDIPRGRAFERQSWWSTTPMVAIVRRVAAVRATSIDPGYANATTTDQSAQPVTPRTPGAPRAAPQIDPSTRFSQPLLTDWTPVDFSPHTEAVEIYTNAGEVELFLNGKSLGTQKLHEDASPITFQVPFVPGTIKAIAKTKGKIVATDELRTAGKPARIVFTADAPDTPLTPAWDDVRYLTATLVDAAGNRIPDSTKVVHFAASGAGTLVAVDNGNLQDHDPFQASQRKLYDGHVVAIVRATGANGKITVTASGDGLPQATVTLSTTPVKQAGVERSF